MFKNDKHSYQTEINCSNYQQPLKRKKPELKIIHEYFHRSKSIKIKWKHIVFARIPKYRIDDWMKFVTL